MNKYRVFRILNSKGKSIGKQDFYTTLGKAKCGAKHCSWRLDQGSKIVEIEVVETPVSEISINLKEEADSSNRKYFKIEKFGNQETHQKEDSKSSIIIFN